MWRRFLAWAASHLPHAQLPQNGVAYMHRYYLVYTTYLNINLHHIVGSDPDIELHNHPRRWAISFILSRSYYERYHRANGHSGGRWYHAPAINIIRHGDFHRLTIPERDSPANIGLNNGEDPSVWTLFITGKRLGTWGFLQDDGTIRPGARLVDDDGRVR